MTPAQHILQIEAEIAALKSRLVKQARTKERQDYDHTNDALRYYNGNRDWEILEYITTDKHNEPGVKIPTNTMEPSWRYHYDCVYKQGWVSIYSVLRLSDNTVWTIGTDLINSEFPHAHPGLIKSFNIEGNSIWANTREDYFNHALERWSKPMNKPLFTTADGVDLFEGDKFWYWYNDGQLKEIDTSFHEWQQWTARRYSTSLSAEKAYNTWLAEQPVLSLNDISRFIDIGPYCELEALVKDKIAKR